MLIVAPPSLQLDLFLRDTAAYQQALARYDRLRPMLQGQSTLTQQSHATGIPYNQLWRDLQRFQRAGLVGLLDHRALPHTRGKSPVEVHIPLHVQQPIVRLALAHPFTARELARFIQTCYELAIEHRGVRRVLELHQLSPAVLSLHYQTTQPAALPPFPARQALAPGFGPRSSPPAVPHLSRISHGRASPLAHYRTLGGGLPTTPCGQTLRPPGGGGLLWAAPLPGLGPGGVDHADADRHAEYHAGVGPGDDGCLPAAGQPSALGPLPGADGPGFAGLSLWPYHRLADGRPVQAGASAPAARAPGPQSGGTPEGGNGPASGLVRGYPVSGPNCWAMAL